MLYRIIYLSISVFGFFLHGILLWQIIRMLQWEPLHHFIKNHHDTIWILFSIGTISIPAFAIGSYVATTKIYNKFLSWIYTISVWYLGAGGYLLAASILSWVIGVCVVIGRSVAGFEPLSITTVIVPFLVNFTPAQKILVILPLILATIVIIHGTINAYILRVTRYTLSSSAGKYPFPKSWIGKNIVVYSDVHTGTIHGTKFLQRIVNKINAQNPYITIMAGDLIDGPKFPHKQLLPLKELQSVLGNYFIPGNHEQYSRDQEMPGVIDSYLQRISDTSIIIDGVHIIGIDYRKETLEHTQNMVQGILKNNPHIDTMPSIGILHDPKNIQALIDIGPNLTLSGHTHGGQLWPGNLIVKKVYKKLGFGPSYYNDKKTLHITSSGAGTAQTPMRVGTNPEIVVIRVVE